MHTIIKATKYYNMLVYWFVFSSVAVKRQLWRPLLMIVKAFSGLVAKLSSKIIIFKEN